MWPFKKKIKTPKPIWRDIKREFLREEIGEADNSFWFNPIEHGCNRGREEWIPSRTPFKYYVYAIHQKSMNTNDSRILEVFETSRVEEFNNEK